MTIRSLKNGCIHHRIIMTFKRVNNFPIPDVPYFDVLISAKDRDGSHFDSAF